MKSSILFSEPTTFADTTEPSETFVVMTTEATGQTSSRDAKKFSIFFNFKWFFELCSEFAFFRDIQFHKNPNPGDRNPELRKIPKPGDKNPETEKIPNSGDKNPETKKNPETTKIPNPEDLPKIPVIFRKSRKIPKVKKFFSRFSNLNHDPRDFGIFEILHSVFFGILGLGIF